MACRGVHLTLLVLAWLGAATASAADAIDPAARPASATAPLATPAGFAALSAAFAAIGPRPENSAAEAAAFALIETTLKGAGLSAATQGLSDGEGGHSFSRIVEARIPGDREDEIAVVVPVTSFTDSADPAEGIAGLALALAEAQRRGAARASGANLPVSLRFVFLGAERRGPRSGGEEASFGSERWISGAARGEKLAVIYLSADRATGPVYLRAAGTGILAPFWYYDRARSALAAAGADLRLEPNKLQVYRLGLVDRAGPISPYLEADIPALEVRSVADAGTAAGEATGDLTTAAAAGEWFPRFVDGFVAANAGGFLSDWDKHYLPLQLGRFSAVIRERTYVLFVVGFAALVSVSVLAVTVFRRDAVKHLLRRMPVAGAQLLAIMMAILAVFLFGKLMARIDASALGSDEAWTLAPKLLAIARTASSFLLFLGILSLLVERKVLTPNPYFYEAAALVCLAADIFAFSAIKLSLSFYFIWAFLIVGLSLLTRKAISTLLAYALMYAPLGVLGAELLARPEMAVYGRLISPQGADILGASALLLPFFAFSGSPLLFYARPGAAYRRRLAFALAAAALAIEGGALAAASASMKGSPGGGEIVVSETLDQDRGEYDIVAKARRRLGAGAVKRGAVSLSYDAQGDSAFMRGSDASRPISVTEERSYFLDRATERISIAFARAPNRVRLRIDTADELRLYDSNLPCEVALDGRSAEILVGDNPGERIQVRFTSGSDLTARLRVEASYLSPSQSYALADGSAPLFGRFAVVGTFPLGLKRAATPDGPSP